MTLYYLNSAPNPDDDRGKRTGDPLTPPRGAPFTGDVASLLIREAREGAAVEIEQLGVLLRSPNTAMGELAKQAAGKVTHPRFLLTKASWSARAGEPPPREAMIFGGAYPSGRVLPPSGGLTLVLMSSGLMVYGRELGSKGSFRPLSSEPSNFSPYAHLMAKSGITPGMIVDELRKIAQGLESPQLTSIHGQHFQLEPIAPECCIARPARKPRLIHDDFSSPQPNPPQGASTKKTAPQTSLAGFIDKGTAEDQALSTKPAEGRKASVRSSLANTVIGLGAAPIVFKSFLGGDPGLIESGMLVASVLAGAAIFLSGRRRTSR